MTEERKETLEEEKQHQGTDEEPLSRMSRNAGRYQKQKKKVKERRPAPAFTEKLASAWSRGQTLLPFRAAHFDITGEGRWGRRLFPL